MILGSFMEKWKAERTDMVNFVHHSSDKKIPFNLLQFHRLS